ncbi:MAG: redox-regulated ATPase YchF [Actinobacteria bacterium]|nr:redox-regulated ATPase YchF [Actinomycetota bacterium]
MEHLGLVGLPDSGHGALFSALTGLDQPGGFEPVKGVAPLPDERVDRLGEMSESKKVIHATFEIDYIPGVAPGGKAGEGLGSKLLGSLRDCDAILFVLRSSGVDPADDLATLEYELVLADLVSVEQRLGKQRRAMKGDKALAPEVAALEHAQAALADGMPVYRSSLTAADRELLTPVFLLTNKPVLSVVNLDEERLGEADAVAAPLGDGALAVCVDVEAQIAGLDPGDQAEWLETYGISESVLPRLARNAYHLLGRRTFLTTGEKESRAWSFRAGARAPECAGVIHSDLERGFIRAEVIDWRELLEIGSWPEAKELGKLRVEGKDYEVGDGDVVEIRFNV